MIKLEQLINELCPDGVEFKKVKDEIETADGEVRIFVGGKTAINARGEDIPNANITGVLDVLLC